MKKKIEDDATFCSYIDKHISLPVSWTRHLPQHDSGVIIIAISVLFANVCMFVVLELKEMGLSLCITVPYKYRRNLSKERKQISEMLILRKVSLWRLSSWGWSYLPHPKREMPNVNNCKHKLYGNSKILI
jgi:hypothetical protein